MENHRTFHALVLNFHQPAGNLEHLLEHEPWEARQILYSLDRVPQTLWKYEDVGKAHLSLSGTLLETISNPDFQRKIYGIVDCGSLLWHLQNRRIIEILGTAYYHPVLPLIPKADRLEQIGRWRGIAAHLFWRNDFQGFWPPEMGFSMEIIPILKRFGYRYVVVDSEYIKPLTPMSWQEIRYRPHVAEYGGEEIIVVVRDRELSNAQESGMTFTWFDKEVRCRTMGCNFPPLVVTCTDGDNGGWFRNTSSEANFWGAFYQEFMNRASRGHTALLPVFIHEYLDRYGAHGKINVDTGAWNTGWHHGRGFVQWQGSRAQKAAAERVFETSRAVYEAIEMVGRQGVGGYAQQSIENAMWHLLRAETSCNFYWGEAWVGRCHTDLDQSWRYIEEVRALLDRTREQGENGLR